MRLNRKPCGGQLFFARLEQLAQRTEFAAPGARAFVARRLPAPRRAGSDRVRTESRDPRRDAAASPRPSSPKAILPRRLLAPGATSSERSAEARPTSVAMSPDSISLRSSYARLLQIARAVAASFAVRLPEAARLQRDRQNLHGLSRRKRSLFLRRFQCQFRYLSRFLFRCYFQTRSRRQIQLLCHHLFRFLRQFRLRHHRQLRNRTRLLSHQGQRLLRHRPRRCLHLRSY